MIQEAARDLMARLHEAQNEFYGGGSGAGLEQLLTADVTWIVPGESRIAGTYRGRAGVFEYFENRRALAGQTFRMAGRDVLVGEGDRIAALTDGFATIRGVDHRWSTVGVYDVIDGQVGACWLLALDQRAFDAIWAG
jgi:ketosteroid isomerase-like protein